MRISTSQVFNTGVLGIQRNQADLLKTQNQMATGRRILTPADDPIAASEALVVNQSKLVNTQYLENQGIASSELSLVETNLTSVINELQNVHDRAIQAGNDALGTSQRGMIAEELKQRLSSIMNTANARDGQGRYIFSGFQTQTQPFTEVGSGGSYSINNQYVAYNGDQGQRNLQVSASQQLAISEVGSEVFMQIRNGSGNLTGKSVFDSIQNMIDILDPNSPVPYNNNTFMDSLNEIQGSIENISRARSSVGSRLAALDSLGTAADDVDLQYEKRLSDLQDVDYSKAISDLTWQQTQLQAAQKSFAQINQMSLFNYI